MNLVVFPNYRSINENRGVIRDRVRSTEEPGTKDHEDRWNVDSDFTCREALELWGPEQVLTHNFAKFNGLLKCRKRSEMGLKSYKMLWQLMKNFLVHLFLRSTLRVLCAARQSKIWGWVFVKYFENFTKYSRDLCFCGPAFLSMIDLCGVTFIHLIYGIHVEKRCDQVFDGR